MQNTNGYDSLPSGLCRLQVAQAQTQCRVVERVLRYPDGHVRTIRYPEPSIASNSISGVVTVDAEARPSSPPSPSGDWHICSELDDSCAFDPGLDLDLPGAAPVEELWGSRRGYGSQQSGSDLSKMPKRNSKPVEEFGSLPSSPAALLEYLNSEKFASERQKLLEKVDNSFEVLHGCPWLQPKPLITVAVRKEGAPHLSSYTLPVAVEEVCPGIALESGWFLYSNTPTTFKSPEMYHARNVPRKMRCHHKSSDITPISCLELTASGLNSASIAEQVLHTAHKEHIA